MRRGSTLKYFAASGGKQGNCFLLSLVTRCEDVRVSVESWDPFLEFTLRLVPVWMKLRFGYTSDECDFQRIDQYRHMAVTRESGSSGTRQIRAPRAYHGSGRESPFSTISALQEPTARCHARRPRLPG